MRNFWEADGKYESDLTHRDLSRYRDLAERALYMIDRHGDR